MACGEESCSHCASPDAIPCQRVVAHLVVLFCVLVPTATALLAMCAVASGLALGQPTCILKEPNVVGVAVTATIHMPAGLPKHGTAAVFAPGMYVPILKGPEDPDVQTSSSSSCMPTRLVLFVLLVCSLPSVSSVLLAAVPRL